MRYYYDSKSKKCQLFEYGGCEGNANRFRTFQECNLKCNKVDYNKRCVVNSDFGTCDKKERRYFYNQEKNRCDMFFYSGCGGNLNNYKTRAACLLKCTDFLTD